jgi:hypothetical protein
MQIQLAKRGTRSASVVQQFCCTIWKKRIKTRSQMPNEEFSRDCCGANHDMTLFVNTLPKSVSYN